MNCIHFRGAAFVHVGPAQMCMENGVSIYMWSAMEVAWLAPKVKEQANFWGFEGFLPEFSQTCPKSFERLCLQIFSLKDHEDLSWEDLQKKVFMCFFANVGRHFMKSIKVRPHFCPDFQRFCADFQGFCPDFQ